MARNTKSSRTIGQKKKATVPASFSSKRNVKKSSKRQKKVQPRKLKMVQEKKEKEQQIQMLMVALEAKGRSLIEQIHLIKMEKEVPESLLNCPICCFTYSKKKKTPFVGSCGHTICTKCVRSLQTHNCPICRAGTSFCHASKNFLAYDLLDQMSKLAPVEEEEDEDVEPPEAHQDDEMSSPEEINDENNMENDQEGQEDDDEAVRYVLGNVLPYIVRRALFQFDGSNDQDSSSSDSSSESSSSDSGEDDWPEPSRQLRSRSV